MSVRPRNPPTLLSARLLAATLLAGSLTLVACGPRPLSPEECQELIYKIDEISFQHLSEAERQRLHIDLADANQEDLDECARGESWSRVGYDCVLEAATEDDLRRCFTLDREGS